MSKRSRHVSLRREPGVHDRAPGSFVLTLPWPAPPLRQNDRLHWSARARAVRDIRHAVAMLARPASLRIYTRCDIGLVWHVNTAHRRDSDGPAPTLKAAIDGLVDAGVLPDDRHEYVRRTWTEIHHGVGVGVDLIVQEVTE